MTLDDLTQTIAWLAPEERRAAAELIQSFQQHFAERQIPVTPILVLRIRDYLRHHFLSDRVESDLIPGAEPAVPAPTQPSTVPSMSLSTINCQLSTASPPTSSAVDHRLAEQVGRTQARQRRSLKDLEITINLLDPASPYRRSAARALAKSHSAVTNEPSAQLKPGDPKFMQNLIEEVGIDLNDPDFFDNDDDYDVSDPEVIEQVKRCPAAFPHHTIERFAPFVPEAVARLRAVGYPPALISQLCKTPNNAPQTSSRATENPCSPTTTQEKAQSISPISQHSTGKVQCPEEKPHPPHLESLAPLSIPPDPPSPPEAKEPSQTPTPSQFPPPNWKSPIPPTPPPKVFIYKVKPTPFNQRQFKKSSPT